MAGWHRIAALVGVGVVLATPVTAVRRPAMASTPSVPCPTLDVNRPGLPSSRPSPPALRPEERSVGGAELATAGLAIPAGAAEPAKLTASSWLVADLNTGAVLGGCGPHEYATPASVQKLLLMAAFLPKLDPTQVVEVTRSDLDFEPGSSAVGLLEGGRYSIETLWLGLLLKSGNDAANVLAHVGGGAAGMPGGVEAMNAEARRLGAYQTHAATPSGLDGPGQFTSAYDLALIARVCFARDDFRRYVSTDRAEISPQPNGPGGFQITNDNGLLHTYPGMLGGKTGFTDLARQTYVGVAERGGRRLVVTLLGAETQPLGSYGEVTTLLNWGFGLPSDASVGRLITPGEVGASPSAAGGSPAAPAAGRSTRGGASLGGLLSPAVATAALLLTAAGVVLVAPRQFRKRRR